MYIIINDIAHTNKGKTRIKRLERNAFWIEIQLKAQNNLEKRI